MLLLKAIFIQSATQAATLTLNLGFESHEWQKCKNSPSTKLLSLRKGCRNVFVASKTSLLSLSLFFPYFLFILAFFLVPHLSVSFLLYFLSFSPFSLPCPFATSSYNDQIKYYARKISEETPRIFRSVLDALPRPISTTLPAQYIVMEEEEDDGMKETREVRLYKRKERRNVRYRE